MSTFVLDNLKLKQLIDKLEWENNIPKNINYAFTGECEVCENNIIAIATAPYFVGNVSTKELHDLFDILGFTVTDDMINVHREHINAKFERDKEVEETAKDDMALIESDLPKHIDEEKIIDSTLRGLYARRLFLEKRGEYSGKEYKEIVANLHSFTSLKLKMKGVIKSEEPIKHTLVDMVDSDILEKIGKIEDEHTGND